MTNLGLFESFFFILRRALFVISALLLSSGSYVLLAVGIYCVTSFLHLAYMLTVQPMIKPKHNYVEVMNEVFVLMTSYYAILLLDGSKTRAEIYNLGNTIKWTIYLSILTNFIVILVSFCMQIRLKWRQFYHKKYNKKALAAKKRTAIELSLRKQAKSDVKFGSSSMSSVVGLEDPQFKIKLLKCDSPDCLLS
mmetsp:Transcript_25298/g.31669  ORF Transcript_25298/g.31669 Transcript_25298/m.31669 type:complete len:193 (+) Transcript_25298:2369-2947(+)